MHLKEENVSEPFESSVHLLAKALDLPWESGYRDLFQVAESAKSRPALASRALTMTEVKTFEDFLHRRILYEPIQYIVGQWDFLDYTLLIRPPLLCPRPET